MTAPQLDSGRWLLASQAATILHVSPKTISRWAEEGRIAYQRTLGGHRRYNEAYIRAMVDTHPAQEGPLA